MKRHDRKSDCAINFSLENIGDPWSLLIVRDMVFFGKKTFGEFMASDERIGSSVLASRLAVLEDRGIVIKRPSEADGRKEEYRLTEKGLALIPILVTMIEWGAGHDPDTGADQGQINALRADRESYIRAIYERARANN